VAAISIRGLNESSLLLFFFLVYLIRDCILIQTSVNMPVSEEAISDVNKKTHTFKTDKANKIRENSVKMDKIKHPCQRHRT